MRSRRPVTVAAWAFVAAFAFSSAPSTLAQAPRTAIDAAVQDERNRYKARKHEFELRKIDARAEWQIAHLRAGTRSPSHRTGAASSGTSPAAVEPSLEEEAQRHRARLGELDQRMRDAHAQWQTDHRNCRANDACDKRASQNYDDRRLEIAKQKVKEQAAHEKKLAALRAGIPDAVGDVFSSTAGDDSGASGDPSGGRRVGPDVSSIPTPPDRPRSPNGGARDGASPDDSAGDESSRTQRTLPQLGRLPSTRPGDRDYTIAGRFPSGRVTLTLKWERDVTEHGRTIHRAGSCSFVLEYLPTGVAKVYKFRYHNEDTTWPYANRREVEVIDIDPTLPREGAEFGTHGQRQLVEQLALRFACPVNGSLLPRRTIGDLGRARVGVKLG